MTTRSNDWSAHLIRKTGASAEQQIAACMLVAAREGCAAGNTDDCEWLVSCGLAYLTLVCPDDVDENAVLKRLMEDMPVADDVAEGWLENAESFVQMVLDVPLEQEVHYVPSGGLQEMRPRAPALHIRNPERHLEAATLPGL